MTVMAGEQNPSK